MGVGVGDLFRFWLVQCCEEKCSQKSLALLSLLLALSLSLSLSLLGEIDEAYENEGSQRDEIMEIPLKDIRPVSYTHLTLPTMAVV